MARRKHILVVESDMLVADVMAGMLESFGFRPSVAHDGPAARAALSGGKPPVQAVVLSAALRGETGASLAAHIRDLGLPLVMVSGSDRVMNMAADQGLQLLHKPFRADVLSREVNAALSSGVAGWRNASTSTDDAADRQRKSTGPPDIAEPDDRLEKARRMRMKADELRAVGDQMTVPRAQASFRHMAASYDALADRLEARAKPDGESEAG